MTSDQQKVLDALGIETPATLTDVVQSLRYIGQRLFEIHTTMQQAERANDAWRVEMLRAQNRGAK